MSSTTWLFDLTVYQLYSFLGGSGLVVVKALVCAIISVILLAIGSRRGGWLIPLTVTGLAVLAMGNRLLLQPATISVLFLAILLWRLDFGQSEGARTPERPAWRPGWLLVVLFALWGNMDGRVVVGLWVYALIVFGRALDTRSADSFQRVVGYKAVGLAILVVAACANPSGIRSLQFPPELRSAFAAARSAGEGSGAPVHSPFTRDYLIGFQDSPAALAFFPLLVLGFLSFGLNRKEWHWEWFLPWLVLAIGSGIEVRLVPFFSVVAGPVTSLNLVSFFAGRVSPAPVRPRMRLILQSLAGLLAIAFLVAAWPGWLQRPPFEPRRWVLEQPRALEQGAAFANHARESQLWPPTSQALFASPETLSAFAWFCPEERGLHDEAVIGQLLSSEEIDNVRARLRDLNVTRVVIDAADPSVSSKATLERLLADPDEWPVLHLNGGVVVFGWRDPARGSEWNPYKGWEVDFVQRAFRPTASEVAPQTRGTVDRRWWDAFWKTAPAPHPADRDEAEVLFRKSQAMIGPAPLRHLTTWEAGQFGSVVGAASGWSAPVGPASAALRLAFVTPRVPENATADSPANRMAQMTFELQRRFGVELGSAPVGILYDSVRAARRAVAQNPSDARAYFLLGQSYLALVRSSSEKSWTALLPQLMRLRQLQASAAFNRAVALDPRLAEAHLELGRLYLSMNFLDLAEMHFRAYRDTPVRWGGPPRGDRQTEAFLTELGNLTKEVELQTAAYARESGHLSVSDRAALAERKGLAATALDVLLKSDVSAFGVNGMEQEFDLLLRTGRPEKVLEWMTPELRGSLGDFKYFWLRAQANVALGEYADADAEFAEIIGPTNRLPPASQLGAEIAGVAGKALLDWQPGASYMPQVVMRTFSEFDYRTRMLQVKERLARLADVLVLRGLVALEAGSIERARAAFRAALEYSPARWGGGQLQFNGRRIAWDCLGLIEWAAAIDPKR